MRRNFRSWEGQSLLALVLAWVQWSRGDKETPQGFLDTSE